MPLWWTAYSALIRSTQVFNRRATWVRRAETEDLRGYAEEKQNICVGTQSKNRRPVWVRRATKVQVRTHSNCMRRDSISGCVPTVIVRNVVEETVRGHAVRQKGLCGYTQGSRRCSAYARRPEKEKLRICLKTLCWLNFSVDKVFWVLFTVSVDLVTAVDWVIYLYLMII